MEVQLRAFLTSAVDGGEWQLHAPAALPSGKETLVPIGHECGYVLNRINSYSLSNETY